jgi:hypothetical protein
MEVLQRIFTYTKVDGEKKVTIKVYVGKRVPYVVEQDKNGKKSTYNIFSFADLVSLLKGFGQEVFDKFVEESDVEKAQEVVSDTHNFNELSAEYLILSDPIISQFFDSPLEGDVVKDRTQDRYGKVIAIEYLGGGHGTKLPIYHVLWEDGSKSICNAYQLMVVERRETLTTQELNKIRRIRKEIKGEE